MDGWEIARKDRVSQENKIRSPESNKAERKKLQKLLPLTSCLHGWVNFSAPAGGAGKMTTAGEGAQLRLSASNGALGSSDFPKRSILSRPRDSSLCSKPRLKAVV
jgi:hypothetical protein